jgi:hypothetical protein
LPEVGVDPEAIDQHDAEGSERDELAIRKVDGVRDSELEGKPKRGYGQDGSIDETEARKHRKIRHLRPQPIRVDEARP